MIQKVDRNKNKVRLLCRNNDCLDVQLLLISSNEKHQRVWECVSLCYTLMLLLNSKWRPGFQF